MKFVYIIFSIFIYAGIHHSYAHAPITCPNTERIEEHLKAFGTIRPPNLSVYEGLTTKWLFIWPITDLYLGGTVSFTRAEYNVSGYKKFKGELVGCKYEISKGKHTTSFYATKQSLKNCRFFNRNHWADVGLTDHKICEGPPEVCSFTCDPE